MTASLLMPGSSRAAFLVDDWALVAALLRVEVAWVRALVEARAVGADVATRVREVAERLDPVLSPEDVEAAGNPVLPLVRALRAELDDEAATVVHRGLTSQDVLDTALVLLACGALDHTGTSLRRTGDALAALAAQHRTAVAAGRTLTQHAVPVTVGLRAAQWLVGVADARAAVLACRAALPVQCGGAAGTLALAGEVVADPEQAARVLARELGLTWPEVPWHSRRTPVLRLGAVLSEACAALGVLASNVLLLGRPEVGEVREGHVPGRGGSSTMPHKTNPVLSVLVRSAALQAPQLLAQLHLCAGQAVDERPPGDWHAEWPALRQLLLLTATAASQSAELAEGLQVDVAASRQRAQDVSVALLAEHPDARSVDGYLGLSGAFVQSALERWEAARA